MKFLPKVKVEKNGRSSEGTFAEVLSENQYYIKPENNISWVSSIRKMKGGVLIELNQRQQTKVRSVRRSRDGLEPT